MSNSNNEPQKAGQSSNYKNSLANIIKVSTALGLGASGLIGGIANAEVNQNESEAQTGSAPNLISYEVSQQRYNYPSNLPNKIRVNDAAITPRIKEINNVIDSAVRSGNINSALKGSNLSKKDQQILRRLSKDDLREIGTLKEKFKDMDLTQMGVTGAVIF